jgi:hypothetical protein
MIYALLAAVCYLDRRSQRTALRTAREALTAVRQQAAARDLEIGQLSRAVARLIDESHWTPPRTPPAPSGPRMRVNIHPGAYPSERRVVFDAGGVAYALNVDARDVDEREGTLRLHVREVIGEQAFVAFPSEAPRARTTGRIPCALILDAEDAPSGA